MDTPVLQTERMILRAPGAKDLDAMIGFFADDRARFYGGPLEAAEAWNRFAGYVGQWPLRGYGFFAMEARDNGATIGLAGPHQPGHWPEPEMSWLLTDAAHEGRGLAQEACKAVLTHLFDDLGWQSTVSYIDPENHASRALAERLGATPDSDADLPPALATCDVYRHVPQTEGRL